MSKPLLCLSSWLRDTKEYAPFYRRFTKELRKRGEQWKLLENTRDIWCRDFLPVYGTGGMPVEFRYEPAYLAGKDRYRSRPEEFLPELGISPRFCDLKLDGGNLILHGGTAVVSDRVFSENSDRDEKEIVETIRTMLELDRLIIIPCDPSDIDMTGHADGMCRFIDDKHVLLNDFHPGSRDLKESIEKVLRDVSFEVIPLKVDSGYYKENDWLCAINFYESDQALYVPVLGTIYEEDVLQQLERHFPSKEIVSIDSREIVKDGGALNCVSWEIFRRKR
ncbi:agmatine deiminase family protein [Nitratifractor sp.]|uniref:agmatine deiminase family protein n=1 Tax=Nitratifractor sp. TaxID=2268144 RepID=UPI0025D25610|nr:agmatine deiminase family protein [Nitratifractor sp.]